MFYFESLVSIKFRAHNDHNNFLQFFSSSSFLNSVFLASSGLAGSMSGLEFLDYSALDWYIALIYPGYSAPLHGHHSIVSTKLPIAKKKGQSKMSPIKTSYNFYFLRRKTNK